MTVLPPKILYFSGGFPLNNNNIFGLTNTAGNIFSGMILHCNQKEIYIMAISAQEVKALREKTGAGMMDCKKALTETNGDFEKAVDYMREKGLSSAAKRMEKTADEGVISSFLTADKKTGVLIELNCETDFVARTDDFVNYANLLCQKYAEENTGENGWKELTIDGVNSVDSLTALSAKMGEKMEIRRSEKYQTENGLADVYIHAGARLGVMIEVDYSGDIEKAAVIAHELCMQIAAASPSSIDRSQVSAEQIEKELEIYRAQALNEGKPEKVIDRIAEGKLAKFYSEECLLEQPYIKEPKTTVTQYLDEVKNNQNLTVTPKRFIKLVLGGK